MVASDAKPVPAKRVEPPDGRPGTRDPAPAVGFTDADVQHHRRRQEAIIAEVQRRKARAKEGSDGRVPVRREDLAEQRHRSRAGGPREPEGPEMGRNPGEGAVEAVSRQAEAAPVHGNPTFDPVTTPWDVALMAGYGDGAGFDTMQGVDDYVMGRRDAMQEARVSSATEGGPLQLDPFESLFQDDAGYNDLNCGLEDHERPDRTDWATECRCYAGENPLSGGVNSW